MERERRGSRSQKVSGVLAWATSGRRGWWILLALAALSLPAAACGGGNDGQTATASPTTAASAPPSPTATPSGPTATPSVTEAPMTVEEFVIKPSVVRAPYGTVIFKVKNAGTVTHQFLVIKSDLPIAQLPRLPNNAGADEKQLDVVGRIEAIEPGAEAELSIPLDPGTYVLICNLRSDGRSHYLTGMYNQFTVRTGE